MLVLSRKVGESIVITSPLLSGEVVIKFIKHSYYHTAIDGASPVKAVTIGITAPSDVLVLRSELIRDPSLE